MPCGAHRGHLALSLSLSLSLALSLFWQCPLLSCRLYRSTAAMPPSQLALLIIDLIRASAQTDTTGDSGAAVLTGSYQKRTSFPLLIGQSLFKGITSLLMYLVFLLTFLPSFRRQNDGTRLLDLGADVDSNAVHLGNGKWCSDTCSSL